MDRQAVKDAMNVRHQEAGGEAQTDKPARGSSSRSDSLHRSAGTQHASATRSASAVEGVSGVRRAARIAYLVLAWLLPVCVGYQVFLAGMAVFVDPVNWGRHVTFVHLFELVPILLLILAFPAGMPKRRGLYLGPLLLWFLIGLQYAFAGAGRTAVAAFHPVNAMLIFWGAVVLAQRATSVHRTGAEG